MTSKKPESIRKSFGEVTVKEAQELHLRLPGTERTFSLPRLQYTWLPPPALQDQLPSKFKLSLQCVRDSDGVRRFYPWNSFEMFLARASTGGLAILCQRQNLSPHERHSYRSMRLLFLRVHHMEEHFRHRFDSSRDLTIVRSGRREPGERNILAEDLGCDEAGRPWKVRELIRRGEQAARAAGYANPTMATRIHYGLVEAARLNPLPIPSEKVPLLVRSALFAADPTDEPDPKLIEVVTERLLSAWVPHLKADSDYAAFEKWFLGPKSSLIHQLAKQKGSPGGEIDEGEVRRVLLHLGWQAYTFASNCIHAQMRTFQNALPEPLTQREQLYFEHMHLRQPYLGDFPLVLLAPRLGFLKGLLWELWENLPNQQLIPVFHRLLYSYASMAARRREADRLIKRGRPTRFDEAAYVPPAGEQRFQEIASEVRELEAIDCGCPRREWWAELKGKPGATIRIEHRCMDCDFQKESTLSLEKFKEICMNFL